MDLSPDDFYWNQSLCVCSEKQNNLTDKFYGQTVLFNIKALDTQLIFLLDG